MSFPAMSFPALGSLTAGGGLSTSSSAATGDQMGGTFKTGDVSSGGGGLSDKTLIAIGLGLAAVVAVYALSAKKR